MGILSPVAHTLAKGYIRTKFQSSTKFTSQVTDFQICAIGISYKTPFRRAGHIYAFIIVK